MAKTTETTNFRHSKEKRKNIPPAKIASEGKVPKVENVKYSYSPHLAPKLQFDPDGDPDKLPVLLEEAQRRNLTAEEAKGLAEALRHQQPWLEWAGKREEHERRGFEVDPVVLHIHERISARAIIEAARREDVQKNLFADPQQPYHEAVQFYKHDVEWTNRLILGDSLQVMSSLATREGMVGKVQMIYMDPPYGIKFASNFQPEIGDRSVREQEQDLSREAETVKAYRDTWALGIHSYLSYLRDRFIVARTLLSPSGSIFVQIGDRNIHLVRTLLDEVFGVQNFASCIAFYKTSSESAGGIPSVVDFLLHYAKDHEQLYFRQLSTRKQPGERGAKQYTKLISPDMSVIRNMSKKERMGQKALPDGWKICRLGPSTSSGYQTARSQPYPFEGGEVSIKQTRHWSYDPSPGGGMDRLYKAGRLRRSGKSIATILLADDNPTSTLDNVWLDTGTGSFTEDQIFVVQTSEKVVSRCINMSTKPGDLVLDPTCGSGTTAKAAEKWGRRWITIDTSRVAVSLARHRLLTAQFDHYRVEGHSGREDGVDPGKGFICKKVPHITLGSIAYNENLDPIFEKHGLILNGLLTKCNLALQNVDASLRKTLQAKLAQKQKERGKRAITQADRRRWELPKEEFEHWNVPFDTDPDWLEELQDAVTAYRRALREKMDEVNQCTADNADYEVLVDQPEVVPDVVRVSGPFTVEGVLPAELSLDEEGQPGRELFDHQPWRTF